MLTFMQLALKNSGVLHQKQQPSALSTVVVQDLFASEETGM
jgi:hypothetical protein